MTQHVLIVEDEAKIASLLKDYLVQSGFEATIIHDGADDDEWLENNKTNKVTPRQRIGFTDDQIRLNPDRYCLALMPVDPPIAENLNAGRLVTRHLIGGKNNPIHLFDANHRFSVR